MEAGQIEKKVTWLDEQRRKDVESLENIENRLSRLEEALESKSEQLKSFSSDLTRLSALSTRINQFDDSLHKHRQEITRHLDDLEGQRTERQKQLEQLRKSDQEDTSRRIDALHSDLKDLKELDASMEARKDEEVRLTREIDAIKKSVDDLTKITQDNIRSLTSAEESRKLEARRVTDLQGDTSDLRRKIDTSQGSMDAVEDRIRRLETRLGEVSTGEAERRDALTAWTENQERKLVDFERSWREWEDRFERFEEQAKELDDRMKTYEETYRGIRQLHKELDDVIERLDRRINEITEMQRLAEDRTKQEWSGFRADDQKRWNTYKLTNDEQWREHTRMHDKISKQLDKLQRGLSEATASIEMASESQDRRIMGLLGMIREWADELEAKSRS
jgi:chromosome segregation ATPase